MNILIYEIEKLRTIPSYQKVTELNFFLFSIMPVLTVCISLIEGKVNINRVKAQRIDSGTLIQQSFLMYECRVRVEN